jgi:hypothetical protein
MGLYFEWDDNKARLNFKNHDVSFDEAKTVFIDSMARIFADEAHSHHKRTQSNQARASRL